MRDLVILGTEVHACEMAEIVERVNRAGQTWRLLGFIASGADAPSGDVNGYPVLGTPEAVAGYPKAWFIAGNDFPRTVPVPADRTATLVDPSCFVSRSARIGAGERRLPRLLLRPARGRRVACSSA